MIITDENELFYLQALKVDFLTERWEREWYALALMAADAWGKKVDRENKLFKRRHRLIDKYNI